MNLRVLACAALVAGCGLLVLAPWMGGFWQAVPSKLVASCGFVLLALVCGARNSAYGRTMLVGFVLCWLGDAFLLGSTDLAFLLGLSAFLSGHICYSVAFARRGVDLRRAAAAAVPVFGIAAAVVVWLEPSVPADLKAPVWGYAMVISAMLCLAVGCRARGAAWLVPIGAGMFFVSDLAVAMNQFLDNDFPHGVWGLPLYYGGQALLALSVEETGA